uniref:PITH domain containing 1 n=1 Tax=Equus caballus TaxID=9796 RepID=A0A9L0RER5_HORSE
MGEDDDSHPSEMRLYKNIPQMSFDDTDREPDQTFSLNRDLTGELEYATKISRFSNVYHLSIHISKNFGADTTKVFYIGLRGEWTELRRHEVTICNYEASANPADHRVHQRCVCISHKEGLQLEILVPACSFFLSSFGLLVKLPSLKLSVMQ